MLRPAAALLALALLAGCGTEDHDESLLGPVGGATGSSASASASTASGPTTGPALLRDLASSVLTHDRERYAALLGGPGSFRARQLRLYDNLQRLPVTALRFTEAGGVVTRSLALGSYDAGPVVGPAGLAVAVTGGRALVVPDDAHRPTDPWDLAEVRAATGGGVLVVGDVADADRLPALHAAARAAVLDDARVIERSWSHRVVVYAFRDRTVLASYSRVPGADPDHLGALTYPVRSPDGATTGSRVAVLPAALDAPAGDGAGDGAGVGADLRRILRHEVTHAALGATGQEVPTWLSEGVAEHVAVAPVPASRRRLAAVAVAQAAAGTVELPGSAGFNDADQTLHYAEAWQACEYLAATRGPGVLWDLIDAMARAGVGRDGTGGPGQDAVLQRVTGLDTGTLALRTAERIRRTYG